MSDISNILPSYLSQASTKEKEVFFQTLICLAQIDGIKDISETNFIKDIAFSHGIKNIDDIFQNINEEKVIQDLKIIKNRHLAMELIRELCILSHIDNILSEKEVMFIGKVGLQMGIELEKIEQISNWIIDRIIWIEQAKLIFEEND